MIFMNLVISKWTAFCTKHGGGIWKGVYREGKAEASSGIWLDGNQFVKFLFNMYSMGTIKSDVAKVEQIREYFSKI